MRLRIRVKIRSLKLLLLPKTDINFFPGQINIPKHIDCFYKCHPMSQCYLYKLNAQIAGKLDADILNIKNFQLGPNRDNMFMTDTPLGFNHGALQ